MNPFRIAVLAFLPLVAGAQVDPELIREFAPFEVGDEWAYSYSQTVCEHVVYGGGCQTERATYSYRVTEEVVRGTDTLAVVRGGGGTRALLGFRADSLGWTYEVVDPGDSTSSPVPPLASLTVLESMGRRDPTPWTFDVGGTEYTGEARAYSPPTYVLVRGVGLVSHVDSWMGTGGQRRETRWTLARAVVGGVPYGPVATASDDAPDDAAEIRVGPNPTRGPLRVRARLAAPGAVRVEVTDRLGRRVWAGESRASGRDVDVRVDLGRVAPGTYLVRVLSDGAPVARATVTRAGDR